MFAARKQVFIDRLGWSLPALAGQYELDQFDDAYAHYLILTDGDGRHRASSRLLRTDRPHLLGDLYAMLCSEGVPCGPTIREVTRFCLDPAFGARERRIARNELVSALADHAITTGISAYTGIAGIRWFEQIAEFGWDCRALGPARTIDGQQLVALHITIDPGTIPALEATGIYTRPTLTIAETGLVS
jgi:acyl homoserine lactone synthase/acyl-homoserine lactone synthase